MRNRYLKEFILIQNYFKQNRQNITPINLYVDLLKWGTNLKESKDTKVLKLYNDYISYFLKIDIIDYSFEPLWYDFDELLDSTLLRKSTANLEDVVVSTRDILWEIISFKTTRDCKILTIDNLRLLTNSAKNRLFFCCDNCGYCEDIYGKKVEKIDEILYPATTDQISEYDIRPCLI